MHSDVSPLCWTSHRRYCSTIKRDVYIARRRLDGFASRQDAERSLSVAFVSLARPKQSPSTPRGSLPPLASPEDAMCDQLIIEGDFVIFQRLCCDAERFLSFASSPLRSFENLDSLDSRPTSWHSLIIEVPVVLHCILAPSTTHLAEYPSSF